jgi:hypothetical protein
VKERCPCGAQANHLQDGIPRCIPCADAIVLAGWPMLTPEEQAAVTARVVAMGSGGQGRLGVVG